ncbi:MAG TPA: hypothetical protein VF796_29260 [Humisphaera sp.]
MGTPIEPTSSSPAAPGERRPIKARSSRWASALSARLAAGGVTPNAISAASVAFAAAGAAALVSLRWAAWCPWLTAGLMVVAILGIQGRLVCNLLDGMVAVEGGKGGPLGGIYNDLPDRLADPLLLAAAGYAAWPLPFAVELGWLAAAGSLLTAYVRVLGKSLGAGTTFAGPMAKQHRMALLTGGCLVAAGLGFVGLARWPLYVVLAVVAIGCVLTCGRRLKLIAADLRANAAAKAATPPLQPAEATAP